MKRFQSIGLLVAFVVGLLFNFTPVFAATGAAAPVAAFRTYTVAVGAEDANMGIDVNMYFPSRLVIHAGDTVMWRQRTKEIHTVTFLGNMAGVNCVSTQSTSAGTCVTAAQRMPGQKGPALPPFVVPVKGMASPLAINQVAALPTVPTKNEWNGKTFVNSGILGMAPGQAQTFSLRFMTTGNYAYYCLVHGTMMSGVIQVVAGSVSVPSPSQVNAQAGTDAATQMVNATNTLHTLFSKVPAPVKNANGTTTYHVVMGMSSGKFDFMRFFPRVVNVKPGDTVVWSFAAGDDAPHTVSFLNGATAPQMVTPVNRKGGPPVFLLNPQLVRRSGGSSVSNSGVISSGLLLPGQGPQTFSLKIASNATGTLNYECELHAESGMIGEVVVKP